MRAPGWPCGIPATLKSQENFVAGHPSDSSEVSPTGRSFLSRPAQRSSDLAGCGCVSGAGRRLNLPKSLVWVSVVCYSRREERVLWRDVIDCHQRGHRLGVSIQISFFSRKKLVGS